MSQFIERTKPDTKIQVLAGFVPNIEVHPDALAKMQIYVEGCSDEIGWLGTAYKTDNNTILIRDVYLFDQEVHATTTEITPEGLATFAEELLTQEDGIDIWNNMKMWGHSHVHMDVQPSGQDNDQMRTFAEGGHDWFVRLIANKKGAMKIDLYDYARGCVFIDLPWTEAYDDVSTQIENTIAQLYEQLARHKQSLFTSMKEPIEGEMKEKVRKKSYYGNGHSGSYGHTYPINRSNTQSGTPGFSTGEKGGTTTQNAGHASTDTDAEKKNSSPAENGGDNGENTVGSHTIKVTGRDGTVHHVELPDIVTELDDMNNYFTVKSIMDLAHCRDIDEVEFQLIDEGYDEYFSFGDVVRIYFYSKQIMLSNGMELPAYATDEVTRLANQYKELLGA